MVIIREIVPGTSISIELSPAELYSAYEEQRQLFLREDAEAALDAVLQDLDCAEIVSGDKMFPDDKVREQFFAVVIAREEKYANAGVSVDVVREDAVSSALQTVLYPIYKKQILLGTRVKEKDVPGPDDMAAVMKMMAANNLFW